MHLRKPPARRQETATYDAERFAVCLKALKGARQTARPITRFRKFKIQQTTWFFRPPKSATARFGKTSAFWKEVRGKVDDGSDPPENFRHVKAKSLVSSTCFLRLRP